MDCADEESDQEWSQPWDKDTMTESHLHVVGNTFALHAQQKSDGNGSMQQHHGTDKDVHAVFTDKPSQNESDNSLMSRMKLNDNKAGMEGLDREKINQIIYEASKGSRYFENELKKEEQVNKRIEEQMKKIPKLTDADIQQGTDIADKLLADLESGRDLSRTIVHIDMDAFFAAVEMRENPKLRNVPMAVGGNDMLSTSNYLARRFGVRAAMPGFIGKKLCPGLVIVPASYEKYQAVSKDVKAILSQYDPNMCPMSLDEAYLDITEHLEKRKQFSEDLRTYTRKLTEEEICSCVEDVKQDSASQRAETQQHKNNNSNVSTDHHNDKCPACDKPRHGSEEVMTFGLSADEAVREMRFRIHAETRITASAGIAPNMLLAKVCSDKNKPNGQYVIPSTRHAIFEFIRDLPIRKVFGIGKVSEKMLAALGVTTCTDLYNKRGLLYHLYSNISFNYFMRVCIGVGSTRVERDGERKSIGVERTFSEISKPAELYKKCYELSEALAEDMSKEQMLGKTVTLKLKLSNFEMRTRSHTQIHYISDMESIYNAAKAILRQEIQAASPAPLKLRLMGVRMTNLINEGEISKQKTISGLFEKIKTKTRSDMDQSVSRSESHDPGAPQEQSKYQEQSSSVISKCNQDTLHTKESEKNVDQCKKLFPTHTEINSAKNYTLEFPAGKTTVKSDPVHSMDTSGYENFAKHKEQHSECFESVISVNSDVQADTSQHHTFNGYAKNQSKPSLFSYISHSRTDYDQLSKSVFWKNCMTDKRFCGYTWHEAKNMVEESNSRNSSESDSKETVHGDLCVAHPAEDKTLIEIKEEYHAQDPVNISTCCSEKLPCKHKSGSSSSKYRDPDAIKVEDEREKPEFCRTGGSNQERECQIYECPVCSRNLYFKNLDNFTEHIDECLVLRCVTDEEKAIQLESGDHGKTSEKLNELGKEHSDQSARELELCTPSTSADYDDILICPVCNAPQRKSSMMLFNQHVDACLNRQTIKEIVQESRPTVKRLSNNNNIQTCSKKQKTDHKMNNDKTSKGTILSFFKGLNR